jgi:hypothetical protein
MELRLAYFVRGRCARAWPGTPDGLCRVVGCAFQALLTPSDTNTIGGRCCPVGEPERRDTADA